MLLMLHLVSLIWLIRLESDQKEVLEYIVVDKKLDNSILEYNNRVIEQNKQAGLLLR